MGSEEDAKWLQEDLGKMSAVKNKVIGSAILTEEQSLHEMVRDRVVMMFRGTKVSLNTSLKANAK